MTVEIAALSSLGLTSFRRNPFAPRFSPLKNASSSSKHLIEGLAAADTALSIKADFMEALTYRSLLLRALAAIEQDPARRRALEADADATAEGNRSGGAIDNLGRAVVARLRPGEARRSRSWLR